MNVWKTAVLLRTNWHRLTTALGEGGKLRWLVTGFSRLTSGGLKLSKVLAGSLVRGFMSAARAVLWIGRALMMNPIGPLSPLSRQQLTLSTATGGSQWLV